MKRLVVLMAVAVLAMGVQTSFANCGNCPGDKPKADKAGTCASMEKLNLTADQKAKVQALCDECTKGKCDKTAKAKMQKGMKEILTEEQYKQWDAQCKTACGKAEKSGKGCCPGAKKAEKKAE
jgi:hypothetical protein